MLVLGWPGYTQSAGRLFGSVIDPVVDNPPVDVVLVRAREKRPLKRILVPVSSGPNSRRAVKLAISMAHQEEEHSIVNVMTILPHNAPPNLRARARQTLAYSLEGVGQHRHLTTETVEGASVLDAILQTAETGNYDLIVMGATEEPLFRNVRTGSLPAQVARHANVSVMIIKRRSSLIQSMLRQTVVMPSTGDAANGTRPPEHEVLADTAPSHEESRE